MDHHDDDPAEQLRRAQARHEADRTDSSAYESLDAHDTREIPVVRRHRGRRWAIGAAVAAVLATGIAVPALAAGGSEPAAGGEPAQVQPADAGTPTAGPTEAPTDAPSGAPAPPAAPSDAPAAPADARVGPAACPPASAKDAPRPPAPGKNSPKPPAPGKDAPQPPAPPSGAPTPGATAGS